MFKCFWLIPFEKAEITLAMQFLFRIWYVIKKFDSLWMSLFLYLLKDRKSASVLQKGNPWTTCMWFKNKVTKLYYGLYVFRLIVFYVVCQLDIDTRMHLDYIVYRYRYGFLPVRNCYVCFQIWFGCLWFNCVLWKSALYIGE